MPTIESSEGKVGAFTLKSTQSIIVGTNGNVLPIPFGQMFNLWAAPREDGILLETTWTADQFLRYGPGEDVPRPKVELLVAAIRTELGTNEVLLLGSGTGERVVEWSAKPAILGDIPIFGDRFFTKRGLTTNYVRRVMIVRPVR